MHALSLTCRYNLSNTAARIERARYEVPISNMSLRIVSYNVVLNARNLEFELRVYERTKKELAKQLTRKRKSHGNVITLFPLKDQLAIPYRPLCANRLRSSWSKLTE